MDLRYGVKQYIGVITDLSGQKFQVFEGGCNNVVCQPIDEYGCSITNSTSNTAISIDKKDMSDYLKHWIGFQYGKKNSIGWGVENGYIK